MGRGILKTLRRRFVFGRISALFDSERTDFFKVGSVARAAKFGRRVSNGVILAREGKTDKVLTRRPWFAFHLGGDAP